MKFGKRWLELRNEEFAEFYVGYKPLKKMLKMVVGKEDLELHLRFKYALEEELKKCNDFFQQKVRTARPPRGPQPAKTDFHTCLQESALQEHHALAIDGVDVTTEGSQ